MKILFQAWKELLGLVETKLELASSYWSLRGEDVFSDPSDKEGEDIFASLIKGKDSSLEYYSILVSDSGVIVSIRV